MKAECFADGGPNRRTVAKIQWKAIMDGKRNKVYRLVDKMDDKNQMAGWKRELGEILHIFNVCPVGPA